MPSLAKFLAARFPGASFGPASARALAGLLTFAVLYGATAASLYAIAAPLLGASGALFWPYALVGRFGGPFAIPSLILLGVFGGIAFLIALLTHRQTKGRAGALALAVFAALYGAVAASLYSAGGGPQAVFWPASFPASASAPLLAAFAAVALYVHRLRREDPAPAPPRQAWQALRGALRRAAAKAGQADAAVTALAVFVWLYLAEGLRLFGGYYWWYVLAWPGQMTVTLWRVIVFLLIPFAAVSLLVYRLRLRAVLAAVSVRRAGWLEGELAGCRERIEDLERDLHAAMSAAREAQARAAAAEANARAAGQHGRRAGQGSGSAGGDEKFRAAKRAFARLYHPDNIKGDGLDKIIRAEIFKEYWRELENIEK